jgi:hypothetical protein
MGPSHKMFLMGKARLGHAIVQGQHDNLWTRDVARFWAKEIALALVWGPPVRGGDPLGGFFHYNHGHNHHVVGKGWLVKALMIRV